MDGAAYSGAVPAGNRRKSLRTVFRPALHTTGNAGGNDLEAQHGASGIDPAPKQETVDDVADATVRCPRCEPFRRRSGDYVLVGRPIQ